MRLLPFLTALIALISIPAPGFGQDRSCTIARVVDGDTVTCSGGETIRLLLIDAPEIAQGPFGPAAHAYLAALLPAGTRLRLELDVEERDRYGRVLAYLHLEDGRMVNRELTRQGYAVPLVYAPNVRHVELIRAASDSAEAEGRGLWSIPMFADCAPADYRDGVCGQADPAGTVTAGGAESARSAGCDPSYSGVCIPSPPPDLDCGDIEVRRFDVVGVDPHRFDGDRDGIGCEGR